MFLLPQWLFFWMGNVFGDFKAKIGIWQGDPLSPFLFVLFSELLLKWDGEDNINCVKLGQYSSPALSHLFFEDEILIFIELTKGMFGEFWTALISIVDGLGRSSMLPSVSFPKMLLGCLKLKSKEPLIWKRLIETRNILVINSFFLGRNVTAAYEDLRRRVESKIQSWTSKLPSQGVRTTLIKHVIFSVSIYSMSSNKRKKGSCSNIEKITIDFLWKGGSMDCKGFTSVP